MPFEVAHPVWLGVVAIACSPYLFYAARWFFDDLPTFLEEAGFRKGDDIWWRLIRIETTSSGFWLKVAGFVGGYAILVGLAYHTVTGWLA